MASKPAPASSAPDLLGRALLPLRAFLGFTFCFAGLQKLANPRFFDAGDPASIQAQLAGAARRSPVHTLISPLTHVAVPLGVLIALGELAVGVGTLLGLRARLALRVRQELRDRLDLPVFRGRRGPRGLRD